MRVAAATITLIVGIFCGGEQALAGDPAAGHRLAARWCSSCHAVDELHAGSGAPPFAAIAQRNGPKRGWVRAWLMAPHPAMPELNLSRAEIDDIVAYLDSLAPPKSN